jgi:hypothetical protein
MEFSQFESIDMAEYGLLAEQNDLSLSFRRKACLSSCHYPKLSRFAIAAFRPGRAVDISRW